MLPAAVPGADKGVLPALRVESPAARSACASAVGVAMTLRSMKVTSRGNATSPHTDREARAAAASCCITTSAEALLFLLLHAYGTHDRHA